MTLRRRLAKLEEAAQGEAAKAKSKGLGLAPDDPRRIAVEKTVALTRAAVQEAREGRGYGSDRKDPLYWRFLLALGDMWDRQKQQGGGA